MGGYGGLGRVRGCPWKVLGLGLACNREGGVGWVAGTGRVRGGG